MWPVGFSGGSLYETPIVKQGKVILFSVFYLFRPYGSLGSSMMEASYIVAISFICGGNQSTRRKSSTCHKSMTNFIT
jgi:hypothetical protein